MKKTLLIMRHSEAKDATVGGNDYERPLTPAGEEMARAMGTRMLDKNLWPDVVLCSSAIRTQQTADILKYVWEGDMEPMLESRTDLYQCAPDDVIKMVRAQDSSHTTIMVIGHNPTVHQLTLSLTGEGKKALLKTFPPASCAVLELNLRSWSELAESKATLVDVLHP